MSRLPRHIARLAASPLSLRLQPRLSTSRCSSSSASSSAARQPSHRPQPPAEQPSASSPDRALPAPVEGDNVTVLDVSGGAGATVKLGALGPLVVNQDGSMSRVSNWAEMTAIERESTLRVLGKRNKLRLAALRPSQGNDSHEPKE